MKVSQRVKFFLKKKAFKYSSGDIPAIENATLSYSQEGEDLLLSKLFGPRKEGFFVDVGAHHPKLYSNTYFYYKKGWRGINIDPLPGIMDQFDKLRPNDINLGIAISDKVENLTYYMFEEPALNTFLKEVADWRLKEGHSKLISTKNIDTFRLDQVLDKYLPEGTKIDFLSIDVEGLDFQVLMSNNWKKYRPKVILAECLLSSIEDLINSEIYKYMKEREYFFFAKTVGTVVFIDNYSKQELGL